MKEKRNIMVDIETIGKVQDATIFQIAAASFNIETGEVLNSIDLKLDIKSCNDLKADGDTLLWWLNTDKELLTKLLNEGNLIEPTFYRMFSEWLTDELLDSDGKTGDYELAMWGNGISFDIVRLRNKYENYGKPFLISFRNEYDVRTIVELAADYTGRSINELKQEVTLETETKHDALDDVNYQIRLVHHCYKLLMK